MTTEAFQWIVIVELFVIILLLAIPLRRRV